MAAARAIERRILGVLVEKQKTSKTADSYPLTLNALVTGCNQKSNRDPVLDLDEIEVEEGLTALQKKGLIERVTGGRAERFRHRLYDVWTRNGPELAVLAELLLRGPQTKGDLRGRAGRMDAIDTLDALDGILKPLASAGLWSFSVIPIVAARWSRTASTTPDELARLNSHSPRSFEAELAPTASTPSGMDAKLAAALGEIESLKARTAALESEVAGLKKQTGLVGRGLSGVTSPVNCLLSMVGHQYVSMYSMMSSVPFSCVTIGFIFGLYIASVRSRTSSTFLRPTSPSA